MHLFTLAENVAIHVVWTHSPIKFRHIVAKTMYIYNV